MHLDLKLKNIMFKSQSLNTIVLLDFGISKLYRENSLTGILAMSTFYCPPEIKDGEKSDVSDKSDIFSLGMYFVYCYSLILEYYMKWLQEDRLGKCTEEKDL